MMVTLRIISVHANESIFASGSSKVELQIVSISISN